MPGYFVFSPNGQYSKRIAYLEKKKAEAAAQGKDFDPLKLGNPKLHPAHKPPPTPADLWAMGSGWGYSGGWGNTSAVPAVTAAAPAAATHQNVVHNSLDYADPISLASTSHVSDVSQVTDDDVPDTSIASGDEEGPESCWTDPWLEVSDEKGQESHNAKLFIAGSIAGFVSACVFLWIRRRF